MRFGGIWGRAVVITALVMVGACSEPEPKEPSAPASSATPTATAPTLPAQAEEDTPEGAAAFVKHYIDVFNYASNTGDVGELSRLSSPKCEGCQSYIDLYRDTYAAGGYFKGGEWVLSEFEVQQKDKAVTVLARLRATSAKYKEASGSEVRTGNPENSRLAFELARTGGVWTLDDLERLTESS